MEVIVCGNHGKNLQINPEGKIGSHENKGGWETMILKPCPADNAELAGYFFLESTSCGGKLLQNGKDEGLHMHPNRGGSAAWKLVHTVSDGKVRTHLQSLA